MPGDTRRIRRKILVATTNPGKIAELRAMLDAEVDWVGLADFPQVPEVEEDGKTFAENARKKATVYARATGIWTLSDDSGLVIDALGDNPGCGRPGLQASEDPTEGPSTATTSRRSCNCYATCLQTRGRPGSSVTCAWPTQSGP